MTKNEQGCLSCVTCGQPAQEPVAYRHLYSAGFEYCDVGDQCNECEPLYTRPHQWQGLTDYEINEIVRNVSDDMYPWKGNMLIGKIICAIEAKLKDKNSV